MGIFLNLEIKVLIFIFFFGLWPKGWLSNGEEEVKGKAGYNEANGQA